MENQIKSVGKVKIPDGVYSGVYGGYVVTIDSMNSYEIKVDAGIRGFSECSVKVENSEATIEIV